EVAEVTAPRDKACVVVARDKLRTTERIREAVSQHERQRFREKDVAEMVEEAHRLSFHRIEQAAAIDEVGEAVAVGVIEAPEQLRRHREICVEHHEHLARTVLQAQAYGVALAFARLL